MVMRRQTRLRTHILHDRDRKCDGHVTSTYGSLPAPIGGLERQLTRQLTRENFQVPQVAECLGGLVPWQAVQAESLVEVGVSALAFASLGTLGCWPCMLVAPPVRWPHGPETPSPKATWQPYPSGAGIRCHSSDKRLSPAHARKRDGHVPNARHMDVNLQLRWTGCWFPHASGVRAFVGVACSGIPWRARLPTRLASPLRAPWGEASGPGTATQHMHAHAPRK